MSVVLIRPSNIGVGMKVIAFNGSPRLLGNTSAVVNVVLDELEKEGIETEYVHIYEDDMIPCNHCNSCEIRGDGRCINEDDRMNEYLVKMASADGVLLAAPSYFGGMPAQLKIFLERAGYTMQFSGLPLRGKVGGAVAIYDHDGGTSTYSEMVNWMLRNGMVVCGTHPLTIISAKGPGDYLKDTRGCAALAELGKSMARTIIANVESSV